MEFEVEIKQILADQYGMTEGFYEIEDIRGYVRQLGVVPIRRRKCTFTLKIFDKSIRCTLVEFAEIFLEDKTTYNPEGDEHHTAKEMISTLMKKVKYMAELEAKNANLEQENASLKEENAALRLLPDAPDYLAAKKHYESISK